MSAIRDFVMNEPLFETHAHMNRFSQFDWNSKSWEEFVGYGNADFATSSGRSWEELVAGGDVWKWWPFVATTGYGQAASMGCRALTGLEFEQYNAKAITRAVQRLIREHGPEGLFKYAYGLVNVRWSVNDPCWHRVPPVEVLAGQEALALTRFALRIDELLAPSNRDSIRTTASELGQRITTLASYDRALDEYVSMANAGGRLAAFKIGLAYHRDLDFEKVGPARAAKVFESIKRGTRTDARPLHDYLAYRHVERARGLGVPVQVHTGYLAGNWGDFRGADPSHLLTLLGDFKDVRFDLFHAGWPWTQTICAVGKAFPNVWLNMCWMWAMSPAHACRVLDEWLSAVPHNKILAFGSDTGSPFTLVGHTMQAREGIARVLERKVERGDFTLDTARMVARAIMHENARALYGTW